MRVLLVGNYGVGNVGDEALRQYFEQSFQDVTWKVVSAKPTVHEYARFPGGIRSACTTSWFRTVRALWQCDAMLFGGGSLFTDAESWYACLLWWWHAFWAWLFRKKIILAFQGIGPFHTYVAEKLTKWVVRRAAYISVRDQVSYERVQKWKPRVPVLRTFDPVFLRVPEMEYPLQAQEKILLIPRKNSTDAFVEVVKNILKSGRWQDVICVSMQPNNIQEQRYMLALQKQLQTPLQFEAVHTILELASAVANCSFVVSQRYHGALVAVALGRELQVVPQQVGDKISEIQTLLEKIPLHNRKTECTRLALEGEKNLQKFLSAQSDKHGKL